MGLHPDMDAQGQLATDRDAQVDILGPSWELIYLCAVGCFLKNALHPFPSIRHQSSGINGSCIYILMSQATHS